MRDHPKIPRIWQLEQLDSDSEARSWWFEPADEKNLYTSLASLNIVGLQPGTTANFSIPYEYMYADCKARLRASGDDVKSFLDQEAPSESSSNGHTRYRCITRLRRHVFVHLHDSCSGTGSQCCMQRCCMSRSASEASCTVATNILEPFRSAFTPATGHVHSSLFLPGVFQPLAG